MDSPTLTESSRHGAENLVCRPVGALVKDRHQSRAGVLGVDIDRIFAESLEGDLSGSEAEAAFYRKSPALQKLGEHLGQQKRFSEWFRGDDDGRSLSPDGDGAQRLGQPEPEDGEAGGANPREASESSHAGIPSPARSSNCRT